jgi:hypothetical protein
MKITKTQLRRIVKEAIHGDPNKEAFKRFDKWAPKNIQEGGVQVLDLGNGTKFHKIPPGGLGVLDLGNGTIQIQDQYDESAVIEFTATEIRALIDVLYSIQEESVPRK